MKKIITTLSLITISLLTFGQTSMRVLDMLDVDFSNSIYDVSLPVNTNITTEMLAYNSDSVHALTSHKEGGDGQGSSSD